MTEKRSDYRKSQRHKKIFKLWQSKKTLPDNKIDSYDEVDVNPEFKRNKEDPDSSIEPSSEEKVSKLKQKLNWAIFIVIILIIGVLFALFKL
ncbi:hypothetical protein J2Z60_000967 [Lactobacillus colini]|uniref:Uncharacterized protein n=1 Tax=Lactobacillus colini TaxID=1819254 RepID=A0ABS4MDM5_9LACO|nr:hypothetical protein [Lactobacillus colini]MBP2057795.1 hypothetical protein [Lactobacillus colini]